eukprot:s448_g7.t1
MNPLASGAASDFTFCNCLDNWLLASGVSLVISGRGMLVSIHGPCFVIGAASGTGVCALTSPAPYWATKLAKRAACLAASAAFVVAKEPKATGIPTTGLTFGVCEEFSGMAVGKESAEGKGSSGFTKEGAGAAVAEGKGSSGFTKEGAGMAVAVGKGCAGAGSGSTAFCKGCVMPDRAGVATGTAGGGEAELPPAAAACGSTCHPRKGLRP